MKATKKAVEKLREKVEQKIEDRESMFENRTEDWQESEKGSDFVLKTDALQEFVDYLSFALDSLDAYFE